MLINLAITIYSYYSAFHIILIYLTVTFNLTFITMFTSNTIVQQHLQLLRIHCQEWKSFFSTEIQERNRMGMRHQMEKGYILSAYKNCFETAAIVRRQTMELWEFKISYQEKRIFLSDRQSRQLSDSLEILRRSGYLSQQQNA